MLEKTLQSKILAYLKTQPHTVAINTVLLSQRGFPDILVCHKGRFIFIEVKSPQHKPQGTPLQEHRMILLRRAGAVGFVTNSFDDFISKYFYLINSLNS